MTDTAGTQNDGLWGRETQLPNLTSHGTDRRPPAGPTPAAQRWAQQLAIQQRLRADASRREQHREAEERTPTEPDQPGEPGVVDRSDLGVNRVPYVGSGSDEARRSAHIDREQADALPGDDPRRAVLLNSAEWWDRQFDVEVKAEMHEDWDKWDHSEDDSDLDYLFDPDYDQVVIDGLDRNGDGDAQEVSVGGTDWGDVADSIDEGIAESPSWPALNAALVTVAARDGYDVARDLPQVAAESPLPTHDPAGELYYRLLNSGAFDVRAGNATRAAAEPPPRRDEAAGYGTAARSVSPPTV